MTLAIGDGGNDVNMIQKADIGVGIFGKEGYQAAFASDYAFANFAFLWRLLFVHGRWSYVRTANFINFFFYKNLVFTLPQFWFSLYSGFSGQSIFDSMYLVNYNTIFTSVAPLYYGTFEQDIDPSETDTIRKALPYVYSEFRKKNLFSPIKFLFWWLVGIVHSFFVFYMTKYSFEGIATNDGMLFELWQQSIISIGNVFCVVFLVVIIGTDRYSIVTFFAYFVCTFIVFFPVGTLVLEQLSDNIESILWTLLCNGRFWVELLFTLGICGMIVYIPKKYATFFNPSLVDLLQRDRNDEWKRKVSQDPNQEQSPIMAKTRMRKPFDQIRILHL